MLVRRVTELDFKRNISGINLAHQVIGLAFHPCHKGIDLLDIKPELFRYLGRLHLLLEVESCSFTLLLNLLSYRPLVGRQCYLSTVIVPPVRDLVLKLV